MVALALHVAAEWPPSVLLLAGLLSAKHVAAALAGRNAPFLLIWSRSAPASAALDVLAAHCIIGRSGHPYAGLLRPSPGGKFVELEEQVTADDVVGYWSFENFCDDKVRWYDC